MQKRITKQNKDLVYSFEGLRKVKPVAKFNKDPKMLLLNNVAAELVKPAYSPYYAVAIDPGGVYKRKLYLVPSETPTKDGVRFHGGNKEIKPNRLYVGNLIYTLPGFNMGESCTYVVDVQTVDEKKIIVLTELMYQQS